MTSIYSRRMEGGGIRISSASKCINKFCYLLKCISNISILNIHVLQATLSEDFWRVVSKSKQDKNSSYKSFLDLLNFGWQFTIFLTISCLVKMLPFLVFFEFGLLTVYQVIGWQIFRIVSQSLVNFTNSGDRWVWSQSSYKRVELCLLVFLFIQTNFLSGDSDKSTKLNQKNTQRKSRRKAIQYWKFGSSHNPWSGQFNHTQNWKSDSMLWRKWLNQHQI